MKTAPLLRRTRDRKRTPEEIQSDFYTETANLYDEQFVVEGDYHAHALEFMSALIDGYGWRSVLDVGSGTGRVLRHLQSRHDGLELRGIEPVQALIDQAEQRGVPSGAITQGSGYALPFEDGSFDVVSECAVLHHVAEPNRIVSEMTRVARRAVFLSDENRFGHGQPWRRGLKYALYAAGVWPLASRLRSRGRPYLLNDGDGRIAYSYSVYDSLEVVNAWADRTFLVPLQPRRRPASIPSSVHSTFCWPACALQLPRVSSYRNQKEEGGTRAGALRISRASSSGWRR